ncbi:unnamed protein product [marine sediment metagenome]|uniref:BppU N-terminal domain-containing protein n=1 Tax=marine sediment metagenome TaxID=412755 RepID=X1TJ63_9ZZZZ
MGIKNTITVDRGNNKTISLTIYHADGKTLYNLTDKTVTLYVKRKISDDNDDAIIVLSTTDTSGTITGIGTVEFYLLPKHTDDAAGIAKANLKDNKQYIYEVEVATDDVPIKYYTALRSTFIVTAQYR